MSALNLVLDTHIWLDWLVFRDASVAPIRREISAGRAVVCIDAPCLAELARVLGYPLGKLALDAAAQCAALDECRRIARVIETSEPRTTLPLCRDRDDQKFLELALAARADLLITKDRELLALERRTPFRIVRPEAFGIAAAGLQKFRISAIMQHASIPHN